VALVHRGCRRRRLWRVPVAVSSIPAPAAIERLCGSLADFDRRRTDFFVGENPPRLRRCKTNINAPKSMVISVGAIQGDR
jgi:hypothetical protein